MSLIIYSGVYFGGFFKLFHIKQEGQKEILVTGRLEDL